MSLTHVSGWSLAPQALDCPLPTTIMPVQSAYLRETLTPMEGWCLNQPGKADRLYDLVHAARSLVTVELGVFGGQSFYPLAWAHAVMGTGYAIGLDPWQAAAATEGTNDPENDRWWRELDLEQIYLGALAVMQKDIPQRYWQFLRTHSLAGPGYFEDGEITLLHQDSNHSEEVSCAELEAWLPKMAPGALWIMDDTDWPTLQVVQYQAKTRYGMTLIEDHRTWRVWQVPQ